MIMLRTDDAELRPVQGLCLKVYVMALGQDQLFERLRPNRQASLNCTSDVLQLFLEADGRLLACHRAGVSAAWADK